MIAIIRGTTKQPVAAQRLVDFFTNHSEYDGFLYIGYPIIGTAEGPYPIDALLVSERTGLIVFSLVEGREISAIRESQDDSYNKLESKLRAHKTLMRGRTLQASISPVTFAPACNNVEELTSEEYPVCNADTLAMWLDQRRWDNPNYYAPLLAVIQAISTIRKGRKKRLLQQEDSRGSKLQRLEESIANLDNLQGRAVIETVDGVQRIRGLAGSGKTIVLALKAAYLHAQHPNWKIAVTFHTRSLKDQFRQLINTFTIEQTNEEPEWDNMQILHAWGAPGGGDRNGLYYHFCQVHGVEYYDFTSAKRTFGEGKEFASACQKALDESSNPSEIYDAILVDEAQDFSPSFLRICYALLTPEKRLVYAYDELQNLRSQALPSPEEIFGRAADGTPNVRFLPNQAGQPQQDIILKKCYRNARPVLVTAHALGFGIYRVPDPEVSVGLIQMFEHHQLWHDIGYQVTHGSLEDGCEVTLSRSLESSPAFLEDHSPIEELIQFHCFNSPEEQAQWVTDAIRRNLSAEEELRPDDIMVINPDPLSTKEAVGPMRKQLFELGINSHLAGVDTSPDLFFKTDKESITFTGIYRAKGNEAGMVYIINAQDCYSSRRNMAGVRNRLFTAMTRSKAWVRVLGIGQEMQSLINEFEQVKKNAFTLRFRYPTAEERKLLNLVNREMTEEERKRLDENRSELSKLLDDLEAKRIYPQDLGLKQLQRLRRVLREN